MLEIRFPSALAMDQLALVADGLHPTLGVSVNNPHPAHALGQHHPPA
jgi:hypothetical protein